MKTRFETAIDELKDKDCKLLELNLKGAQIGDAGDKDLSAALQYNTSLTSLDLSGNQIGDAGAKELARALENNTSLTELGLNDNQIGAAGAKDLAHVLENNTSLILLYFSGNRIRDMGAKDLARALEKNTSLAWLSLNSNQIGDAGAKDLARALEKNTSLTELYLSGNQIRAEGTKDFAGVLKNNTSLTLIDLSDNQIGNEGAKVLARALETNTSLTELDLSGNQIDDAGVKDLVNALKNNYMLLKLDGITLTKEAKQHLNRNKEIGKSLSPLNKAIKKGVLLNDGKTFQTCLKNLEIDLPELDAMPQDSYPAEAYRLLTALGHHSRSYDHGAQKDALHALLPPFKHQAFQHLADKTLGLLLAGDFSHTLKDKHLEKEGHLLSLYGFRNHLHLPAIKIFAQIALFKLIQGNNTIYTYHEQQGIERDTLILTQNEFISLLESALMNLENEKSDSYETQLLKALLESKICYPFSLSTACQSNAFSDAFKAKYPNAKSFTTIEHCLLIGANDKPIFLMDLTKNISQDITEDHFAEYAWQLIQSKTNAFDDAIDTLKHAFDRAFPLVVSETHKAGTDDLISVRSMKYEQVTKVSPPSSLFQSTEVGKNQSQSEAKDPEFHTLIQAISEQQTKSHKQQKLLQHIYNNQFSVQEFNTLYNQVKKIDGLNTHDNPWIDGIIGIKNTSSWQTTLGKLRQKALSTLFVEVDAKESNEDKLKLLRHAKTLPLFKEHRSNSFFTGAWGRTASVKQIEEHEVMFQTNPSPNKIICI